MNAPGLAVTMALIAGQSPIVRFSMREAMPEIESPTWTTYSVSAAIGVSLNVVSLVAVRAGAAAARGCCSIDAVRCVGAPALLVFDTTAKRVVASGRTGSTIIVYCLDRFGV